MTATDRVAPRNFFLLTAFQSVSFSVNGKPVVQVDKLTAENSKDVLGKLR